MIRLVAEKVFHWLDKFSHEIVKISKGLSYFLLSHWALNNTKSLNYGSAFPLHIYHTKWGASITCSVVFIENQAGKISSHIRNTKKLLNFQHFQFFRPVNDLVSFFVWHEDSKNVLSKGSLYTRTDFLPEEIAKARPMTAGIKLQYLSNWGVEFSRIR